MEPNTEKKITAGYSRIPDHSDLRGFSYRAPTNFDFRDEFVKPEVGFWRKVLASLGLGEKHGS